MTDLNQQRARPRKRATADAMPTFPTTIPHAAGRVEPLKSEPASQNLAVIEEAKSLPTTGAMSQGMAAQTAAEKRLAYVKRLLTPYRLSPLY